MSFIHINKKLLLFMNLNPVSNSSLCCLHTLKDIWLIHRPPFPFTFCLKCACAVLCSTTLPTFLFSASYSDLCRSSFDRLQNVMVIKKCLLTFTLDNFSKGTLKNNWRETAQIFLNILSHISSMLDWSACKILFSSFLTSQHLLYWKK